MEVRTAADYIVHPSVFISFVTIPGRREHIRARGFVYLPTFITRRWTWVMERFGIYYWLRWLFNDGWHLQKLGYLVLAREGLKEWGNPRPRGYD